jgi:hypothetical protein
MITRQVMCLFSAYRRDEFADPDGFVVQLGAVLERYPDSVIVHVTSPHTGLQRRLKFPPSIAEVVEACDAEQASQERHAALKRVRPVDRKRLPAPPKSPRERANHFIPRGYQDYDKAVALHEANTDPRHECWYETRVCLDGVERYGIWVPHHWMAGNPPAMKKPGLKRYTADEIIKHYGKAAPVDASQEQAAE